MPRTLARRVVLQMIYERLSGGDADDTSLEMAISLDLPEDEKAEVLAGDRDFIEEILTGVQEKQGDLCGRISAHLSDGWTMERLNRVDLCVLLLGSYELLYMETPDPVAISEAVNLADLFTEPKNKHFINAVLGEISRDEK